MKKLFGFRWMAAALAALAVAVPAAFADTPSPAGYDSLVRLFEDWRAFERPPLRDGAPDYTAATFARRHAELPAWQARLAAIDTAAWPVEARVDHRLVRAEMNGFDFYVRVLKPWERDPAFYLTIWDEPERHAGARGPGASRHHRGLDITQFPLDPRGRGEARRGTRRHPAAARAGARAT